MSRHRKSRKPPSTTKRHSRNKISGDIILIVCEGEKTEPTYFTELRKKWRINPVQVKVLDKKSGWTPITIINKSLEIKKGIEERDEITIDEVWCVFDHEGCNKDSRFDEAVSLAHEKKIKTAISVPGFEFWFLIHFTDKTPAYDKVSNVIKDLKKYINNYKKSGNYIDLLMDKIEHAFVVAKRLRKRNQETGSFCPATDVDLLVKKIKSLSREFF